MRNERSVTLQQVVSKKYQHKFQFGGRLSDAPKDEKTTFGSRSPGRAWQRRVQGASLTQSKQESKNEQNNPTRNTPARTRASALCCSVGASKLYEGSRAQIQGAIEALVTRAIKSGDVRKDLEPFDLLRALIGVSNVASSPD